MRHGFTLLLCLFACNRSTEAPGSASTVSGATPSTSAPHVSASTGPSLSTPSASALASAGASAAPEPAPVPTFEPEDPKAPAAKIPAGALPPGRVTKLEGVGLTIAPAFPYKIEDRKTHWTVTDESERARDFYLMRKMFSAKSPLGEVLPCADKSAGAAHAEPDGSYTYSCWGRSSGNGKWFARLVPTNDKQFETVQCMGSAKKESAFKLIETTCRSIKKQ